MGTWMMVSVLCDYLISGRRWGHVVAHIRIGDSERGASLRPPPRVKSTAIRSTILSIVPASSTRPPFIQPNPTRGQLYHTSRMEPESMADAVHKEDEDGQAKKEAWEEVMKRVEKNDDGMEKGWKEDIDTLLVFAGLFSAVVTAFTIESYQWLSEDPSDQSVAILSHISAQLNNRNISSFDPPRFTPDPSLVRINAFWFLSLILALVDALFGLMCKQWLREYRRPTNTRTPEQWLSLRCFKSESFERWHVPSFLAALPIILEVALFCFFAGLLELLWTKHKVPFAIAAAVIGFAVLFYAATTLLPGIDIIRLVFCVHPEPGSPWIPSNERMNRIPEMDYLCPYKSPQAWATFKLLAWILSPSFPLSRHVISHFLRRMYYKDGSDVPEACIRSVSDKIHRPENWFSVDLDIIQRFSQVLSCPDMYGMKAHRWLVQEFRDIPLMIPHLQTLLRALPPNVVMPTVFDAVIARVDREWEATDVESALHGWALPRYLIAPFTYSRSHTQLIFSHYVWIHFGFPMVHDLRAQPLLSWGDRAPLPRILQLMLNEVTLGLPLIPGYIENFGRHCININTESFDFAPSVPLITDLAKSDLHRLVDKQPVVNLLIWFNEVLDYRGLDDPYTLIDALDMFRVSQGLRKDCFTRPEGFFPVSMTRLNLLLCDASTKNDALQRMGDFRRAYQDDSLKSAPFYFLRHLGSYLSRNIPSNLEYYPLQLREELRQLGYFEASDSPDEIPCLLTSQEGLSFLRSLNATINPEQIHNEFLSPFVSRWVLGLKCVAHLNKLPLDHFDVRNSQHPLGLPEVGPSGVNSSALPDNGGDSDGGNGLTGDRGKEPSTPGGSSTSAEEGTRGGTSIGWFNSGEGENNADILESHLFDYLIAT
ncbi:hypothetical protein PM082_004320 [Marasmius tenuissimus]|nr:hypothetical protein PM082_004320 [Marasmius tenuissimus]